MAIRGPTGLQDPYRLVFIGLGGIGSWLVEPVLRYFERLSIPVLLVDGDHIETKNLSRQSFGSNELREYKVIGLRNRLRNMFPSKHLEACAYMVDEGNVEDVVQEGDVVFVCPDNHKARRVVAEEASKLTNVVVFTAGNELYHGSCHIYAKKNGVELSYDFQRQHPNANDGPDREEGCGELIDMGATQLIAVNFMAAAMVLAAVDTVYSYGNFRDKHQAWSQIPQEIYFGIVPSVKVRASPAPQMVEKKKEEPEEVVACSS